MGKNLAAPVLIKCLKRMEYRGYDSVGVATESNNQIKLKKGTGRVGDVNSKLHLDTLQGSVGIGHTRWATHGKITHINAHPHLSNSGKIAIVHNGIIDNFEELKYELEDGGYTFQSQTDSEIIANLLQKNYNYTRSIRDTMLKTVSEISGHYAFVAMFEGGQLTAARVHKPLILGVGKESYFLSSDVLGFIEQTDDAIYINNRNLVIINSGHLEIIDFAGNKINWHITKVSKEFADSYKGDYAHYTIKEISEQPMTIARAGKYKDNTTKAASLIKNSNCIYITGSGTSYHAALLGRYILAKYAKIKAEPVISSELPFLSGVPEPNSTLIAMSQSGESADVLDAVNIAKEQGCKIVSIVNQLTSSLARESDVVVGMNCGPEIGVAATKSFTSQIAILYNLLYKITDHNLKINFETITHHITEILNRQSHIKEIAHNIKKVSDIYVLGRGIHYPIAAEAALKLKELAYIHAEGVAGGEIKHGPMALVDPSVFAVIINPVDSTYADTITNAREIKARGAKIIGISDMQSDIYDHWIKIPKADELAHVISEIVPIQLLAYYAALEKDTDPDYPRNLAKSVTVK